MSFRHRRRDVDLRPERLDDRCLPTFLWPGMVNLVYGIDSSIANGAGQTVAIVDAYHDPYLAQSLATYDKALNLPAISLSQVSLGSQPDDGWALETTLDVEWVHAVAPSANIVVYEAATAAPGDLLAAVAAARANPAVSVISMSWGTQEFPIESYYDNYFTTPANHIPITFVAASGDDGAAYGASWPAISPNVVSIGATAFYLNPSATVITESAWYGSGGGVSAYYSEPSYQRTAQMSGFRTNPDVSIDGYPQTGELIYAVLPSTGVGQWLVVGGTSASAQLWAGLFADVNQLRVAAGKTTLSSLTALTAMYQNPSVFRDITSGSNGYNATAGYDLVTGLGSVGNANNLWTVLWLAPNSSGAVTSRGGPTGRSGGVVSSLYLPDVSHGSLSFTVASAPASSSSSAAAAADANPAAATVVNIAIPPTTLATVAVTGTAASTAAGATPIVAAPAAPASASLANAIPQPILASPLSPGRAAPSARPAPKVEPKSPERSESKSSKPAAGSSATETPADLDPATDEAPAAPPAPSPALPPQPVPGDEEMADPVAAAIAGWPWTPALTASPTLGETEESANPAPGSTWEATAPSLGGAALVALVAFEGKRRPRFRSNRGAGAVGQGTKRAIG